MKKYFSRIALILIIFAIMAFLSSTIYAVEPSNGSLKIIKYETGRIDESGNNLPLSEVKFQIYQVSDDYEFTTIPQDALIYKEGVTDCNGTVMFDNLPLGRYLVIESEAPENVTEKTANFLVDIPMTNQAGNGFIYDVEVKPKNNTVYGAVTINKTDNNRNPLENVTFKLEEKKGEVWKERKIIGVDGAEKTLATNNDGIIVVEGLPQGEYRFIEISTLPGYILDNKTTYEFNVSMDQETKKTITSPDTFDILNEKLEITKEVANATDADKSFNKADKIDFNIIADIPRVISDLEIYTITDTLPEGLDYEENSLIISGIKNNNSQINTKEINKNNYNVLFDEKNIIINFKDNSTLAEYDSLKLSYTTVFNGKESYTEENTNKVQLKYSSQTSNATSENIIIKEASESVFTGGFYIKKFEKNNESNVLGGAEFKIALSEEDAKKQNFIKENNEDILLVTDEKTGLASYSGLKYGTYYLVETKSPTYIDEDGKEKNYKILKNPVEILVNENTFKEENANKIANTRVKLLPFTGGKGTFMFYVVGITLILGSIILLKAKKGKRSK